LSENARQFGTDNWEKDVLQAAGPVLVDFWAPWCPPCRALGPVIEDLAGSYAGKVTIGKLNVDENEELAARYGIRTIPTLMLFDKGELVTRLGGAPKDVLAKALDAHLAAAPAAAQA
jgi:thioredoxin 1